MDASPVNMNRICVVVLAAIGYAAAASAQTAVVPTRTGIRPMLTASGSSGPTGPDDSAALGSGMVLWDQFVPPFGPCIISQDFLDPEGNKTEMADDFLVPPGETWTVDRVAVVGTYDYSDPAEAVNVRFYADASGLPGALVGERLGLIPVAPLTDPNFVVDLPTPVVLEAGRYWLSVQTAQHFVWGDGWFWCGSTAASGLECVWRDITGFFGGGCASFGRVSDCLAGDDLAGLDLAFALYGESSPCDRGTPAIWEPDFGARLPLSDDSTYETDFDSLDFAFSFAGGFYGVGSLLSISSNGFISLGGSNGDGCCDVGPSGLLNGAFARIAPLWTDLDPSAGSNFGVYVNVFNDDGLFFNDRMVVTWVPSFSAGGIAPVVQVQILSDGTIVFGYRCGPEALPGNGLVGLSPAGGVADPGPRDLGAAYATLPGVTSVYQHFPVGSSTFHLGGRNVVFKPRFAGGWTVTPAFPPYNDNFNGRLPLVLGDSSETLLGASPSAGDPGCGPDAPDVWYSFTAPCDGELLVDTCGTFALSGIDTAVGLFSDATTLIACNDDSDDCGPGSVDALVSARVVEGQVVYVRVTADLGSPAEADFLLGAAFHGYRSGSVDMANSPADPADVLTVNGSTGSGCNRLVTMLRGTPITVAMSAPPAGPAVDSRYVLWVWGGSNSTPKALRTGGDLLGWLVNPSPLQAGSPKPIRCLAGPGMPPSACSGVTTLPGPATFPFSVNQPRGFAGPIRLLLQGVIKDNGAANSSRYSVTNAIELRVD